MLVFTLLKRTLPSDGSPAARLSSVCQELLLIGISQATAKSLPRAEAPNVRVKFLPASDDALLIFTTVGAPAVSFPLLIKRLENSAFLTSTFTIPELL